ncbi:MAG: hypothetical protein WBW06_17075 [Xanthobacteraceae bacterium]|jgi:hypothetical protein
MWDSPCRWQQEGVNFTGKIARVSVDLKAMKKTEENEAAEAVKAAALKKGLAD